MKNLLIAVILLLQFIPSQLISQKNERPKIGLVLSGGGAKGFAHIGVLEVLEREGIPIDYIVGTSIGSIIGGLYSIGYNSKQLREFVQQQEWMDLLSDYLSREYKNAYEKDEEDRYLVSFILNEDDEISFPTGVIQGQNVINTLCKLTAKFHDVEDFSKLPIPFACVAADIATGEEVVLKKGFLAEAIFASMSLPSIFAPTEIDGRLLVDGGIINNYPSDVAKEMGADIIIGVDIQTKPLKKEEIVELTDVLGQMFSYMGYEKYRENIASSDILIEPDITGYSTASFSNEAADTLMNRGTIAALDKIDEIKNLLNKKNIPTKNETVEYIYEDSIDIDAFMIGGIKNSTIDFTLNKTNFLFPNNYNFSVIDEGIKRLYGSNSFNKAYFRIFGNEHKSLAIILDEKNNSTLNAGFNYNSLDKASILINLTFRNKLIKGSRLSFDMKLASNPVYHSAFQFSTSFLPELYLGLTYKYLNVDVYNKTERIASSDVNYLQGEFSIIELFGSNYLMNLGVEGEYYRINPLFSEDIDLPTTINENSTLGFFAKVSFDNLDDKYYPTRGFDVTAKFNYVSNELNNLLEKTTTPIISYDVKSAISLGSDVCFIPNFYGRLLLNDNVDIFRYNAIGGTEQTRLMESHLPFIGIDRVVLVRERAMIFGAELRLRLSHNNFISAVYNFGTHFNRFRDWQYRESFNGAGIKYSFRSFIGPIDLLASTSDYTKELEFFLNVGRWF